MTYEWKQATTLMENRVHYQLNVQGGANMSLGMRRKEILSLTNAH